MTTKYEMRRILSSQEILDVLHEISRTGARVALCGGAALHFYGSDRLTYDVDVLADKPLPGYDSGPAKTFGGYRTVIATAPVDVIIRSDAAREYYEAALHHAKRLSGVPIPVVTPEFMAMLKLDARRRKDELDLEALLLSGHVDPVKSRKIIRKYLGLGGINQFTHVWYEAKIRQAVDNTQDEFDWKQVDDEPES